MDLLSLIIDAAIAIIAAIIIIVSTKRGFVKSAIKLVSAVASFYLAFTFAPRLAPIISDKLLGDRAKNFMEKEITSLAQRNGGKIFDISALFGENSTFLDLIKKIGIDIDKIQSEFSGITEGSEETVGELAGRLAGPVNNVISNAIAFLGIAIVCGIVFALLGLLIEMLVKLPVLKQLNGVLGFIVGLVIAALFVVVISAIGYHLIPKLPVVTDGTPADIVEKSFFLKNFSGLEAIKRLFSIN